DVVEVENRGATAFARCADGSEFETELLVGADGLWSRLRRLVSDDRANAAPYVAYRGTLPIDQISPHAGHDTVVMWVGPQMHFVQYPIRRGEVFNQVAVFRSKQYRADSDDWGQVEELEAHFAQCCGYIRDCIQLMWRDKRWPMFDREPIPHWVKGRIALLGDAAHAMFQYIAQGACQAIEDGARLAREVAAQNDVPQALAGYEAARVLRTARVQLTARAMGAFFHLDGVNAALRNQMMAGRAATDCAPLDWLYGHKA